MVLAIKFEMKTNSGVTIFTPLFNSCVNIVTPLLNSGVTIFTQRLFTPRSWNNICYPTLAGGVTAYYYTDLNVV